MLAFAEKMLLGYGAFRPFGGYINATGEVVYVGVDLGLDYMSASDSVKGLVKSFKALVSTVGVIAFAIVTDVLLPGIAGKDDALKIFLEHVDGYCAEVFFYYTLADDAVEVTNTTSQQGYRLIWS